MYMYAYIHIYIYIYRGADRQDEDRTAEMF